MVLIELSLFIFLVRSVYWTSGLLVQWIVDLGGFTGMERGGPIWHRDGVTPRPHPTFDKHNTAQHFKDCHSHSDTQPRGFEPRFFHFSTSLSKKLRRSRPQRKKVEGGERNQTLQSAINRVPHALLSLTLTCSRLPLNTLLRPEPTIRTWLVCTFSRCFRATKKYWSSFEAWTFFF